MSPQRLSLSAQTAFVQVAEAALSAEHLRSVADLPGAFAAKLVKGHRYWYYQFTEPSGARRQLFVGPDNEAVRALIAQANRPADTHLPALCQAAIALGCADIPKRHYKVLRQLANYGFFRAGGVLIGAHAFMAYGNMMGIRWSSTEAARTQDIDFAHAGRSISLALASNFQVQTHAAIEALGMGFLPISGLAGKAGGAYLIPQEKEFRLDFLTTVGRQGEIPYEHPDLHVTLQPLKFMEYSLENVQQTVLFTGAGAVVANIPHPARYALHKLVIAGEREGVFASKAGKDLLQAALLLNVLREDSPWEVETAWADLLRRGPGWKSRAQRGVNRLETNFPGQGFAAWLNELAGHAFTGRRNRP